MNNNLAAPAFVLGRLASVAAAGARGDMLRCLRVRAELGKLIARSVRRDMSAAAGSANGRSMECEPSGAIGSNCTCTLLSVVSRVICMITAR